MSEIRQEAAWTPAQQDAINLRGKTLLVSAAAGSGKTAVLTERIIRRLTDPVSPIDISRILAVTFTRAAAGELKERISASLSDAIAADPHNRSLSEQLLKLGRAHISTIHSFCYDIIRRDFEKLGINAGVRIADSAESKLLRSDMMNALIDDCYEGTGDDLPAIEGGFDAFADNFVSGKDDALCDLFLGIYLKVISYPEGLSLLASSAEAQSRTAEALQAGNDFIGTPWGQFFAAHTAQAAAHYCCLFEEAATEVCDGGKLEKALFVPFSYERDFAGQLRDCAARSYQETAALLNSYNPPHLGRAPKELSTPEIEYAKAARTEAKKYYRSLYEKYYALKPEDIALSFAQTASLSRNLYALLFTFDARYSAEKQRRGLLDYGDLERYAYHLLYNEDGSRSETAVRLSDEFDEIYIDEYQDVNELQDRIFTAIAKSDNRFMVGDIKQSIYGFRGAAPKLFSDYRRRYPMYRPAVHRGEYPDPASAAADANESASVNALLPHEADAPPVMPENAEGLTIFLSDNFRSDSPVIDFTNAVFEALFRHNSGRVPYLPEDALVCSKQGGKDNPHPVEILLAEKEEDHNTEVQLVCRRIAGLLREGYAPGDITILLRSRTASKEFEEELHRLSIPCFNDESRDFFENPEILLVLCLLNVIDNPTRDIYLAGLLKSPIYGFTLEDLTTIRSASREGSLYDALCVCAASPDSTRCRAFLADLERFRRYASCRPVDKLIWYLYQETGIFGLIQSEGKFAARSVQRTNLMLLYEYARRFEASSFHGLYSFIRYLCGIIDAGETMESASNFAEGGNTVRIMTIHSSKGLQFPVCFLCGSAARFNTDDQKQNILLNRDLGLAARLRDDTGFARFDTALRRALVLSAEQDSIDEEMRVLYVALTRAKERLIVTAAVKDPEALLENTRLASRYLSAHSLTRSPSYLNWILAALAVHPHHPCAVIHTEKKAGVPLVFETGKDAQTDAGTGIPSEETIAELTELFRSRFSYRYPNAYLTHIPAKLSVSRLYPAVLDEEPDTGESIPTLAESEEALPFLSSETQASGILKTAVPTNQPDRPVNDTAMETSPDPYEPSRARKNLILRPDFITAEDHPASGAEKGNATHVFMQFCDFAAVEKNGIEEEIQRLIAQRFIPSSLAALIDRTALRRFFTGTLYREMRQAPFLRREVRFNIRLPAAQFTEQPDKRDALTGESLLVQGIIDCLFMDETGRLTLLDYKTDHFSRTQLADREGTAAILRQRHTRQLSYYRAACTRILRRHPDRVLIYSFALGDTVPLDFPGEPD